MGRLQVDAARTDPSAGDLESSGSGDSVLRTVKRHFCDVLGLDAVGDEDSFFDLGGHSLLALELVVRLEEAVGQRITVATLYDRPTAAGVAAVLRQSGVPDKQYQFLVPVQPEGELPPIFGIHVLGRNAKFYRPLAERLGPNQPIWGLGLAGGFADTSATTDIREVSRLYVDELERCAPTGPVVLAAVSVGSVAAVEVARLLMSRGRHVPLLVLFDAAGPAASRFAISRSARVRIHLDLFLRSPRSYIGDRLSNQREVLGRHLEVAEMQVRKRLGLALPDRIRIRSFVEDNIESAVGLDLAPFPGRITVFKADDPFTDHLVDRAMGWADVALGGVDVVRLSGGHLSMLEEPFVGQLAEEFVTAIERSDRT